MAVSTNPVISWWNRDNTSQVTLWDIGVVDAGTESNHLGVLIWNNRGGDEDVANIVEASLTTRAMDASETGFVVEGKWIRAKVDSLHEVGFTPIGKGADHPVRTEGSTIVDGISHTPSDPDYVTDAGRVSALGLKNDGTKENSAGNFIEVTLMALPDALAPAGTFDFVVRFSYTFT
ncbi:hypothetical protein [Bacillus horti]|uniref:WxL domain-containing protein n=1 Tax=Caldalkalibacillus horti TaxID=77523 RepID=A0ABT9VWB1_9BACI|nr:hypothetical protein [Bacillus horti]MDQ0165154.1 hypothetical protein [Bacillus horti]